MAKVYATVDELKIAIDKTDSDADAALQILLDAAADLIDRVANRPDGFLADSVATTRYYCGTGEPWLSIDECVEIKSVAVKDSPSDSDYVAWDSTDWVGFFGPASKPNFNAGRYNGIMVAPNGDYSCFTSGKMYQRGIGNYAIGVPTVAVTARWGYAEEVPAEIKQLTLMLATLAWKRLQSGMADGVGNIEMGFTLARQSLVDLAVAYLGELALIRARL